MLIEQLKNYTYDVRNMESNKQWFLHVNTYLNLFAPHIYR